MFPFKRNLVTYILTHLKPVFQIYFNWAGCGGCTTHGCHTNFRRNLNSARGVFKEKKFKEYFLVFGKC